MKYIRTKDGIYELMPNIEQEYKVSFDGKTLEPAYYIINHEWVAQKDVIKQADTIEKLCDEFVVMSGYSLRHNTFKTLRNAIKHSKLFPFEVMYIYGAIWTNKGLIYVAKMNEEGELELL